jgi:hypothetical protein
VAPFRLQGPLSSNLSFVGTAWFVPTQSFQFGNKSMSLNILKQSKFLFKRPSTNSSQLLQPTAVTLDTGDSMANTSKPDTASSPLPPSSSTANWNDSALAACADVLLNQLDKQLDHFVNRVKNTELFAAYAKLHNAQAIHEQLKKLPVKRYHTSPYNWLEAVQLSLPKRY